MIKIADNVWKINAGSNVYVLKLKKWIVVDTGEERFRDSLSKEISKIVDPDKIEVVFFTHLHYDHIGNFELFSNAKFYASAAEIKSFRDNPTETVLNEELAENFVVELLPAKDMLGLKIIDVPGHTSGSICVFYEEKGILFSGDTLFKKGLHGRVDVGTSLPDKIAGSLEKIEGLKYKVLCPGHDY